MVALNIRSFDGISPKIPARYLKDSQAQIADNSDVFSGSLKPIKALGSQVASVGTNKQTIYKFGQDVDNPATGWLSWSTDVDVCRSQIAGDTEEWTFYTGDGYPKAIRAGATGSPIHLGIAAPATPISATPGVPPADVDQLVAETRVYTYTYVYKVGSRSIESAPAPASGTVDIYPGQNAILGSVGTISSGYNATHVRYYRAVDGTFLFVKEVTYASALGGTTDTVDPELLGEVIPSLDWLEPPDTLKGLINLPNGVMAGFDGRDVFFCEPYVPHAWPDAYRQTLDYPVVGLGVIDTTLVVLTKGTPYFIQGSHPDSMVVVRSDMEQSCLSKRSIVSFNNTVVYASPDGLMSLSSSGSRMITVDSYTPEQWRAAFNPASIVGFHTDMKYVAFYDTGTKQGSFVYDFSTQQLTLNNFYYEVGYHDMRADVLYLASSAGAVLPWGTGSAVAYQWKSKKFSLPRVLGMSCMQVEAESYPVTAKIYADGNLIHTQTVDSRFPFRLPAVSARDWEFELTGTPEVFQVAIAQSMEELANV